MASRIATAWNFDTDTENRFPAERPLLEDLEDAASGVMDQQPRRTLRNRHYGPQPLMLRPDYKGDFLEDRGFLLDGPPSNRTADSLLDFSNSEEMLKYLPDCIPRDLTDEFYDINRPGEGAGYDDLKQEHDRSWDEDDAPEISEDKIMRMRDWGNGKKVNFKPTKPSVFHAAAERVANSYLMETEEFRAKSVVAKFIMRILPSEAEIDPQQVRTAKMLRDLDREALIFGKNPITKKKDWHRPGTDKPRVSVRLIKVENRVKAPGGEILIGAPYVCTFRTTSGNDVYNTIIQFIPSNKSTPITDLKKLHVRVSCSCNSWLFWGAQFNAFTNDYLYGPVKPKGTPPDVRDPYRRFTICKHVLACIPQVMNYKLAPTTSEVIKKLRKPPPIEVDLSGFDEEIRIPRNLQKEEKRPVIKGILKKWDRMADQDRENFINDLKYPGSVAYMGHKFPETASKFVIQKLKDMTKDKNSGIRVLARSLLSDLI